MNHPETRTFFQMAEKSYRHREAMGVNPNVLELLVKPGGAGMLICLSSFMARAAVLRKTGGFDPKLPYSQDSELLFRLGMLTSFCYVNRPLVWFDRSPAELRHVGVCADWNKVEFKLKDSQDRLEGLLRLSQGLSTKVRKVILEQLRSVHSGWANWYLETGQYGKAREASLRAVRTDANFNVALKCLLTWMSPRLALRAVQNHQEMRKDSSIV
jgi:hypothetical protein